MSILLVVQVAWVLRPSVLLAFCLGVCAHGWARACGASPPTNEFSEFRCSSASAASVKHEQRTAWAKHSSADTPFHCVTPLTFGPRASDSPSQPQVAAAAPPANLFILPSRLSYTERLQLLMPATRSRTAFLWLSILLHVAAALRGAALRPLAHPRLALRGSQAEFTSSKKLAKQLAQREVVVASRAAKQAKKKKARSAAREVSQAAWDALTEEQRDARRTQAAAARCKRAAALAPAQLPISAAAPTCVVDLGFGELMSARELRSLAQQLLFCYAANKREAIADGAWPLRYHLTSFAAGSPLGAQLGAIQGSDGWPVTRHAASYLEAFDRDRRACLSLARAPRALSATSVHVCMLCMCAACMCRLVYLTPEAPEVLGEIDADKVYVIGGLVDRSRQRGLTLARARAAGIATARLPLEEHLQLDPAQHRALAVNHVFEIVMHRARGLEWGDAMLRAMPPRRGATRKADERGDGADAGG